jgi:dolichol-phosphate mannosyltransferase
MQTAIIIPTLNEVENIDGLVAKIAATSLQDSEIIFVDDGSIDGTRERIRALSQDRPIRLLERDGPERGLAGAIVAGATLARAELILVMDADLSHPPEDILSLLQPLLLGQADLVVGSRYIKGGATPGWPIWRRVMSRLASLAALPLTGIHDSMCGFFATHREYLLHFAGRASGFKIVFEMLVRARGRLRVSEIPIVFRNRERGYSKMSLAEAVRFAFGWLRAVGRRMIAPDHSPPTLSSRKSI